MATANEKHQALGMEIMEKYKNSSEQKRFYELDVNLNINFVKGETNSSIDGIYRVVKEFNAFQGGEVIEDENYNIMDAIRREYVNRLTRTFPLVRSVPKGKDYSSKTKAEITNLIIEDFETRLDMKVKYTDFVSSLVDTGVAGFFPFWNTNKGKTITYSKEEREVNGEKVTYLLQKKTGDIDVDIMYFWELFPEDIYKPYIEDQNWFIRARSFPIKQIMEFYGKQVTPEHTSEFTRQSTYNGIQDYNTRKNNKTSDAVLIEYYEKPTSNYPNGLYVVVCNSQVLAVKEHLPYDIGENDEYCYNFVLAKFIHRTKEFFGDTTLSHSRAIQRSFNRSENLKNRMISDMTVGKWFYEDGAIDDPDELSSLDRDKIKVNFGRKTPERVRNNQIDGTLFNQTDSILKTQGIVSGVSPFKITGNTNSSMRSGKTLDSIQERDEGIASSIVDNIEIAMLSLYKKLLRLLKKNVGEQYWKDKYDKTHSMIDFKFSEIVENDIELINKGLIGRTESEEQNLLGKLVQLGIFVRDEQSTMDIATKQNLLSYLKLGSIMDDLEDPYINQMNQQKMEIEDIFNGESEVDTNVSDDNKAHIEEMEKLFTSAFYHQFKKDKNSKNVVKNLENHYNKHRSALEKARKAQLIDMMLQKGNS